MDSVVFFVCALSLGLAQCALFAAYFYGAYLCFRKSWICGLAGLVIGIFAVVVGTAKFVFNKNLLDT